MIPDKQRDDFAAYLRRCNVVRRDSHTVGQRPGSRWLMVYGPGGWIRAYELTDDPDHSSRAIRKVLAFLRRRPGYGAYSWFVIRWKVDPQPGKNAWEHREWNPRRRCYEYGITR